MTARSGRMEGHKTYPIPCVRRGTSDPEKGGYQFDSGWVDVDHVPESLLHTSRGALESQVGTPTAGSSLESQQVIGLGARGPLDETLRRLVCSVLDGAEGYGVGFAKSLY